jgi:ABC-2 type transport system ATP-binding protein
MAMDTVLQVSALHKQFGRGPSAVRANAGIDLDVSAGQVVGLLGHNGAGKSTLVNQVIGLLLPDSGTITLAGVEAAARPQTARRLVSVQAQANVPITGLTPRHAVELVGRIRGGRRAQVRARTARLLADLDLEPWADTPAEKVSGGIARLTAFAMTAVVPGQLVVLDEPTNDVDPVRRRLLWAQIRALADDGAGVLLVTHNVREAERVVDHLAVLDRGIVLAAGTPAELTAARSGTLALEVDLVPGRSPHWLPGWEVVERGHLRATASVPADRAAATVQWAADEQTAGRVERYALAPTSLEDVYIDLVQTTQETAA